LLRQKEHLVFKGVRAEWPTMAEYNRLTRTPIVEVDLRSVFGGNGAHGSLGFVGDYF
jgi:hypothetical protein